MLIDDAVLPYRIAAKREAVGFNPGITVLFPSKIRYLPAVPGCNTADQDSDEDQETRPAG